MRLSVHLTGSWPRPQMYREIKLNGCKATKWPGLLRPSSLGPTSKTLTNVYKKDVLKLSILTVTCVEMAEKAPGDVLLHPGLVVCGHNEHWVPQVLAVEVHCPDEVLPGHAGVPEPRLVLDVVCSPDVDPDNVQRLGCQLLLPPVIVDSLKIPSDDIGKSLPGEL